MQMRHSKNYPVILTCPYSSVLRGCKSVPLGNYNGCDAQDTDHYQVDEAWLRVAIERVVEPRDKAAHNEKGNTRVVQPRKEGGKKTSKFRIPICPTALVHLKQDC